MRIMFSAFIYVLVISSVAPCLAETISQSEAQDKIAGIEKADTDFLKKYPAFIAIEDVVKSDCAAKVPARASSKTFCDCAAALTMELWRSGADPNMLHRLSDYSATPDQSHASDFLRYEGPELYRPLCERGEP
jgi:hypothetical protein